MPKTLWRYLAGEFIKPLFFTLMVFIGIYIIAQLVDEMRGFVEHRPALSVVVLYYFYRIPFFAVQILPLAILLASLFSLGQLGRQNELIAMRGCGISFYQIAFPFLALALFLALVVFGFNEIVIPYTNPRADYLKHVGIEHKPDARLDFQRDRITRSASGNRVLHARHLDAGAGRMQDVIVLGLGPNHAVQWRVDSPFARWEENTWIFENAVVHAFDAQGRVSGFQQLPLYRMAFKEEPREFIRDERDADQLLAMTIPQLSRRIHSLRETGSDPKVEETNLHLKIAFPFANFILAFLGVSLPFIFPTGKRAMLWTAIGFVITLLTGFFYIGFIAVGSSFGKNGALPPMVSVWIANLIFGLLGAWLMRKAQT